MNSLTRLAKKGLSRLNGLSNLVLVGIVLAQEQIPIEPPEGWERLGEISLPGIASTAIKLILVIAALIAFIFLIIGGIRWIVSGGDKAGTEAARNTITAALVGLLIVFAAWAIIRLIETFFGIEILTQLKIPEIPTD